MVYPHKVGIVVVNFMQWKDTIACVESVLASTHPPAWVVIVDNASCNDSVVRLREWGASNNLFGESREKNYNESLTRFKFIEYNSPSDNLPASSSVILLRQSQNNGYAAGNNAGIRLLLSCGVDAVWILNNDTIVEKNALDAMRKRLFSKSRPGLCGSLILYADTDFVQCRGGGKTNPWTGLSYLDGYKFSLKDALAAKQEEVEERINFIYGASVMVSRSFIDTVGLMDERYFLYCEEQDWAYAAKGKFDLSYTAEAIVYHKEGASTGFSSRKTNLKSLYYLTRSRLLLTAKHNPWALPTVGLSIVFAALRMFWRRVCFSRFTSIFWNIRL